MTVQSELRSGWFDCRFRFQQDRDSVADGIYPLTLVAFQALLAAQHQRLPANRAGENLKQVGGNHGKDFTLLDAIRCSLFAFRQTSRALGDYP